jgi:hypothetical protein
MFLVVNVVDGAATHGWRCYERHTATADKYASTSCQATSSLVAASASSLVLVASSPVATVASSPEGGDSNWAVDRLKFPMRGWRCYLERGAFSCVRAHGPGGKTKKWDTCQPEDLGGRKI